VSRGVSALQFCGSFCSSGDVRRVMARVAGHGRARGAGQGSGWASGAVGWQAGRYRGPVGALPAGRRGRESRRCRWGASRTTLCGWASVLATRLRSKLVVGLPIASPASTMPSASSSLPGTAAGCPGVMSALRREGTCGQNLTIGPRAPTRPGHGFAASNPTPASVILAFPAVSVASYRSRLCLGTVSPAADGWRALRQDPLGSGSDWILAHPFPAPRIEYRRADDVSGRGPYPPIKELDDRAMSERAGYWRTPDG
jgi:hypothetical protein